MLKDAEAALVRAAEEIVHFSGEAICTHGQFTLCLSGGSTPADTYRLMATRFDLSVDWKEVHFFWGDERCVAPDHPDSNFGMANRTLLAKLAIKPERIHRIRGENHPSQSAAEKYEEELRDFFSLEEDEVPRLDLVLLGIGENAHTASLFPGGRWLHDDRRLVLAVEVDAQPAQRITLTPRVLNRAARVVFVVTGERKAPAIRNILEGPHRPDQFPAQIVQPEDGAVMWILDAAAASLLKR